MPLTDQGAEKVDSFQDEFLMSYSGDAQFLQFLMSDVQQLLSSHLLPLKVLHILLETVVQTWWDDRRMRVRTLLAFLCGHCQSRMWVNHPSAYCCFPVLKSFYHAASIFLWCNFGLSADLFSIYNTTLYYTYIHVILHVLNAEALTIFRAVAGLFHFCNMDLNEQEMVRTDYYY